MNLGSQSSEAMPRSLQQRMRALDLQPSPAVGMLSSPKYWHSPRAWATNLFFFPFHISTAFLLFGEGKGGLPAVHDEGVFPRYYLFAYHEFTAGREAPGAGTEGSVEDAAVFDFGEVDYPVWLHFDVYRVEGGHEDGGGFGGEGDGAEAVEGGGPVDS